MTFEDALKFNIDQLTLGFLTLRDEIKRKQAELDDALKPSVQTLNVRS